MSGPRRPVLPGVLVRGKNSFNVDMWGDLKRDVSGSLIMQHSSRSSRQLRKGELAMVVCVIKDDKRDHEGAAGVWLLSRSRFAWTWSRFLMVVSDV